MADELPTSIDLAGPQYYLNRELSELEFQLRILNEALDDQSPLLGRVRFLSISTKNLNKFFMRRVSGLKQRISAGVAERTTDGRTPLKQWGEAIDETRPMFERQAECYREEVRPTFAGEGIHVYDYNDLTPDRRAGMRNYSELSMLPTLAPLLFNPAHPSLFTSNLSLSPAVVTRDGDGDQTFTRVKIPQNRPRLVEVDTDGDEVRYVLLEGVIRANLDLLFPNVEVVNTAVFKLTRNAKARRSEGAAEDLIDMIEEALEQCRFTAVVRPKIRVDAPAAARDLLVEQLGLDDREVFELRGPLGYRELTDFTDLDHPGLSLESWTPQPHPRFSNLDTADAGLGSGALSPKAAGDGGDTIFDEIRRKGVLLHHPYHSFGDTVQEFLDEAANDPNVLAIKAAICRTASDSKITEAPIDAADNGRQVTAMVELRARSDEQNNLKWVHRLEEEDTHIAYGTIGLKTHMKTAPVVREEKNSVRLYSHVATSNYHSGTAKGCVDLGVLTADRGIGRDFVKVFNLFTSPPLDEEFRKLLIAPVTMQNEFTKCIRRETEHARADRDTRIVAKMNALEDPGIVEGLYEASMAGVDIDLFVYDIRRLRPGLEGVSETVTVWNVVDRFLEHSRTFYFKNAGDPGYYVGSVDWMTRSLDKRVEAIAPVEDPDIREQLRFVLELGFTGNRKAWEMNTDGSYDQRDPGGDHGINVQKILTGQTLATSNTSGVHRGVSASYPDVPETLLAESNPSVMAPQDSREARASLRGDGDGRDDTDDTAESAVEAGAGAPTNGDLRHVFDDFPEKWYVPNSRHYEYAVQTPDDDRDYRKTAEAAVRLIEKYYGEE